MLTIFASTISLAENKGPVRNQVKESFLSRAALQTSDSL